MGRWPPRPYRSKFIRRSVDYCNRFLKEARIVEYGGLREEGGGWENYTVFYAFSMRCLCVFSFRLFSVFYAFSSRFLQKTMENKCRSRKLEKKRSEHCFSIFCHNISIPFSTVAHGKHTQRKRQENGRRQPIENAQKTV